MNRRAIWGVALLVAGCDANLTPSPVARRSGSEPGVCAPDSGPTNAAVPPVCEGACCPDPEQKECFPRGNPSPTSGAECLAVRDNTGQKNRQFRQTLSVSTTPPGFAEKQIADVLVGASTLKSAVCSATGGASGFIQLIDIDTSNDTARVGFARYELELAQATAKGLCFVESRYDDPQYALPNLPVPQGWPTGLRPPMSLPWDAKPVSSIRYKVGGAYADFDLAKDRMAILGRLAAGGDLQQYTGVHHIDDTAGTMHGFAPVVFIVQYAEAQSYNVIPLREAEIKQRLNDPAHPNCIGSFLGDNPDVPEDCVGTSTERLWGCPKDRCGAGEIAPTSVTGYFLIHELEQVYNVLLGRTLCNFVPAFQGVPYPGWNMQGTCRSDPQWNLADPVRGMPPGDWCAATNSPATDQCHDAWRSISFSTFQAFPVAEGVCPAL